MSNHDFTFPSPRAITLSTEICEKERTKWQQQAKDLPLTQMWAKDGYDPQIVAELIRTCMQYLLEVYPYEAGLAELGNRQCRAFEMLGSLSNMFERASEAGVENTAVDHMNTYLAVNELFNQPQQQEEEEEETSNA